LETPGRLKSGIELILWIKLNVQALSLCSCPEVKDRRLRCRGDRPEWEATKDLPAEASGIFPRHSGGYGNELNLRIKKLKTRAGLWMWIAAVAFSLLSVSCGAQSNCPWLNAATASGVLEGSATTEVNTADGSTGVCVFRLRGEARSNSLRVSVIKANKPETAGKEMLPYESKCTASGLPLRGVGNEAILCASDTDKSSGELVVGRVRDNIFTVAIYAGTANDPAMTKDALADRAQEIAKQVAGILF
jgi:hypothetical protein